MRASTNIAHAIQLCHTMRFSCEVPTKLAMGLALVPRILFIQLLAAGPKVTTIFVGVCRTG